MAGSGLRRRAEASQAKERVNDLQGPKKNLPLCYCRSRAFLTAEAIQEYLDINEWQVAGIVGAIASP
jgi:predicted transcriptional regulator